MKFTQILQKQHIGRYFKAHWKLQGRKNVLPTPAESILAAKGIPVYAPEDILTEKREFVKIDVIGFKPKPIKFDETHRNWNSRKLLTYKDDNVLLEGLAQAKVLTKTIQLTEGLPDKFELSTLTKEQNKLYKNAILGAHVYDAEQVKLPKIKDPLRPAWNFPRVYGISNDRINKLITSKLLQLIESTQDYNVVKERYLSNNLYFSFPFEKCGDIFQFQLMGDTLITSSTPLPPVTSESTSDIEVPDIFPVKHTITLNEENIYELEDIYPIKVGAKMEHPHTLIIHYDHTKVMNLYEEEVTEAQFYGRSLLKTFTAAASYARQRFGKDVKLLPQPVTLQCVQTDGKFFHFGILQLNTLDLDGEGIKNIWYQTNKVPLFDTCKYEIGKPVLEGYNSEVIKHLIAFYNNV